MSNETQTKKRLTDIINLSSECLNDQKTCLIVLMQSHKDEIIKRGLTDKDLNLDCESNELFKYFDSKYETIVANLICVTICYHAALENGKQLRHEISQSDELIKEAISELMSINESDRH